MQELLVITELHANNTNNMSENSWDSKVQAKTSVFRCDDHLLMKCKRDEIVVLTVSWEISESFQEDFTIKSLLDRNWIFVVYAVIRLPLTQSSEIYTDTHTSAEISQEFPLFYFGTKTVHIDFVAAEILSSPLLSVQSVTRLHQRGLTGWRTDR